MPGKHEIARFVRSTFRSVWSLELMCVLRQHAGRDWTPAELVAMLRASDLIVSQSLAALTAAGLVVETAGGSVRYQPVSAELDALAAATAAEYARSPDAVRRMIVAAANSGFSVFADAFRLRKG